MPSARVGRGSKYDEAAKFVLKILPDMDRDKAQFERRDAASQKTGPPKRWLGRSDFKTGTPGYLYAQACALMSGLANFPREKSAIALSDFDFGEPWILGVEASSTDTPLRVSAVVPASHRKGTVKLSSILGFWRRNRSELERRINNLWSVQGAD